MDNERHHESWDDADQGSDSWSDQYEYWLDKVSEETHIDRDELRDSDDYNASYEAAFGLEQGEFAYDGITFDNPKEYAEFLADWLDYSHDDIDDALGYDEH